MAERYAVFTSPNDNWTRIVMGQPGRTKLYMPMWDVAELKIAVEALELRDALGEMKEIPDFPRRVNAAYADEVAYRFAVFGGVARPCLATDAAVVASQLRDLQTAAAAVNIMTGQLMVQGDDTKDGKDGKEESRTLYHCHPSPYVFYPSIKIASPYVMYLLASRVGDLGAEERANFESFDDYCYPEMVALRRAMLKMRVLSLLEEGTQLVATALPVGSLTPKCDLTLMIQLDERVSKIVSNHLRPVEVRGPCFIPQSNEFESIDAFYVVNLRRTRVDHEKSVSGDSSSDHSNCDESNCDGSNGDDSNSNSDDIDWDDSEDSKSDLSRSISDHSDTDGDGSISDDSDSDDSDNDDSNSDVADGETEDSSAPWENVELVIFLVAGKPDPKVNGKELFALLTQLKFTFDTPRRVALVFVVPEGEVAYFKRQYVEGAKCLNGSFPLTAVDDVTCEMDAMLKAAKISCVQDLRQLPAAAALDAGQRRAYELAQSCLRFHEQMAVVTGSGNHNMLQYIPQFVWGVPV